MSQLRSAMLTAAAPVLAALLLPPVALTQKTERLPSWIDAWREATVAIGRLKSPESKQTGSTVSKNEIFDVIGTGVVFGLPLLSDPTKTPWLVTARHVLFDPQKGWDPERVHIRFSWFEEKPITEYHGIPVVLKRAGRRLWHPHPAGDLACLPLPIRINEAGREEVPAVPFQSFASEEDIFQGAAVLTLGYPKAVGSEFLSRAIVRQGIISLGLTKGTCFEYSAHRQQCVPRQ
jgi:hypothetical protein